MKTGSLFSTRKLFKSNLLAIMATMLVLVALVVVLAGAYTLHSIEEQTREQEYQKLTVLSDRFTNYIHEISLINTSFALSRIDVDIEADSAIHTYNSIDQQANLCMTIYNFVMGLRIENEEYEITKGGVAMLNAAQNKPLMFSRSSTLLPIAQKDSALATLCLFQEKSDDLPYSNAVTVYINSFEFGKNIISSLLPYESEYIVDQDGVVTVSNRSDMLRVDLRKEQGIALSDSADMHIGNTLSGDSYSIRKIEGTELYALRIFTDALYKDVYQTLWLVVGIFFVALLVLFTLISYFITRFTYRPIRDILESVEGFYPLPVLKNFDEVHYIKGSLREIARRNETLSEKNRDQLIALQQQQMLAMQAQISPHFMFNMLETVNCQAISLLGFGNPVEKILQPICRILRYSMDLTSSFATIEEELKIAEDSIVVFRVRHEIEIDFTYRVDPELLELKMLKFCFEPIIENAVIHGFANKQKRGSIEIDIRKTPDNYLQIRIADDGKGMREEALRELTRDMQSFSEANSSHIGLRNINCRLHLLYGDRCSFRVESTYDKGTVCDMRIPLIEF